MVTPSPVRSLSNDVLTERDRFGWYVDRVREGIAPFTLTSPHARDFPARVMSADLGTAQLATFSFPPLGAVRTSRHIRRDDPETYHLALIRRGLVLVHQRRHEAVVQAAWDGSIRQFASTGRGVPGRPGHSDGHDAAAAPGRPGAAAGPS